MKDTEQEPQPATVTERSKQAGDIQARWAWVEPAVWTERMLTALCRAGAVQSGDGPRLGASVREAVNHRPESRMREIRTSGSEGGETGRTGLPYPYRMVRQFRKEALFQTAC